MQERSETSLRDRLARQRTEMANERTLLSYIRTALGLIALGVSAVWWLEGPVIQAWGSVSIVGGVVCMGIGIRRFLVTKARIRHQPE